MIFPLSLLQHEKSGSAVAAIPLVAVAMSAFLFAPGLGLVHSDDASAASCSALKAFFSGQSCVVEKPVIQKVKAKSRQTRTVKKTSVRIVFAPPDAIPKGVTAKKPRVKSAASTKTVGVKIKVAATNGQIKNVIRQTCRGRFGSSGDDSCIIHSPSSLQTASRPNSSTPTAPGSTSLRGIPGSHVSLSGSVALSGTVSAGSHTVSVNNGVSVNQNVGVSATTAPGTSSGMGIGNGMSSASSVGSGTASGIGQGYGNSLSETAGSMAGAVSNAANGSIGGGVGIGAGMGASGSVD